MFEQCHEIVLPPQEQSHHNGKPLFGLTVPAGSGLEQGTPGLTRSPLPWSRASQKPPLFWHLQSIPGLPRHFGRRETDKAKASHLPGPASFERSCPMDSRGLSKDEADTCKVQENQRAQEAPGTDGEGKGTCIQQLWQSLQHPEGQEPELEQGHTRARKVAKGEPMSAGSGSPAAT